MFDTEQSPFGFTHIQCAFPSSIILYRPDVITITGTKKTQHYWLQAWNLYLWGFCKAVSSRESLASVRCNYESVRCLWFYPGIDPVPDLEGVSIFFPLDVFLFSKEAEVQVFSDAHIIIVQELCESRGGRPGLSVLTSLLVSVDVKLYWTMLWHWSQLVPNKK